MDADPDGGDHAEGALGAEEQLAQVGAGGGGGGAAEVEHAGRGDHPQAAHHVVEPSVAGRVLAGGAGGREAADGGETEALRIVAEFEAALGEQGLGGRAGETGAEEGLAGGLVEVEELVEPAQVERDDGGERPALRVQSADDAGAAAERHDGDPALGADREQRGDLVLAAGQHDGVGRVLRVARAAAQQVGGGLAAGPGEAVGVGGAEVGLADDGGERREVVGGEGGRPQDDLRGVGPGRGVAGDAEGGGEQALDVGGQLLGEGRVAPGVPLHRGERQGGRTGEGRRCRLLLGGHALQFYTSCQVVTSFTSRPPSAPPGLPPGLPPSAVRSVPPSAAPMTRSSTPPPS